MLTVRNKSNAKLMPHGRDSKRGFVLLATLVTVMLLASMAGWVQMRSLTNQRLAAGLAADLRQAFSRDAIHDRLRGMVADQMAATLPRNDRPRLNSIPFEMRQDGHVWEIQVQDVQGQIDLYSTNLVILNRAVPDAEGLVAAREDALAMFSPGGRFPHLAMTMARFGLDQAEAWMFTQSNPDRLIRLDTAPEGLRRRLGSLAAHLVLSGQATQVHVTITRKSRVLN